MIYIRDPRSSRSLAHYAELVRAWAPRVDLVASSDLDRFETRHIEDSLRLADLVASCPPGPGADNGSGAGLPGVPLAIVDPGRIWHLIEPRRKRAAFLEEVVRELQLDNVAVVPMTAERAAQEAHLRASHSAVVARALAPPGEAFDLMLPLVAPGGTAALLVGETAHIPPNSTRWRPGIATVTVTDQ